MITAMSSTPALRRLIDLPGIRDIEFKALMNPRMADEGAAADFPEIDELSRAVFGLTADEADDVPRPEGWDRIERKPRPGNRWPPSKPRAGTSPTTSAGPCACSASSTSSSGSPLRESARELPFQAEPEGDDMASSLAAEAARFRRNRP